MVRAERPSTTPTVREWRATGEFTGSGDDVLIDLDSQDRELGEEGYRLDLDDDVVTISANTAAGAFYATRTLRQLMAVQGPVPGGMIRDWPRYAERGLMIDLGRQHQSASWIAARIEEMAALKLNFLHLHFSENGGWRIESDQHPEVVSDEHLSKADIGDLIELAASNYVIVVPEIDMPGHMGAALRAHPELQLRTQHGVASPHNLDFTLPAARRFAFELVEEYLDLFPGPYWNAGGDEYLLAIPPAPAANYDDYPQLAAYANREFGPDATPKDGIIALLNSIDDVVREAGKTTRVYNDGLGGGHAVSLRPDIVVEWWSDMDGPDPQTLVAAGHRIMNIGWSPTYYITGMEGELADLPRPQPSDFDGWSVNQFRGPMCFFAGGRTRPYELAPDEPAILGSKLHIWCDDPTAQSPEEIATRVEPYMVRLAEATWSG